MGCPPSSRSIFTEGLWLASSCRDPRFRRLRPILLCGGSRRIIFCILNARYPIQTKVRMPGIYQIYANHCRTTSQEAVYLSAVAYSLFSLGRFVAAGASYFLHIKPRYILLGMTIGALATATYSMLAG